MSENSLGGEGVCGANYYGHYDNQPVTPEYLAVWSRSLQEKRKKEGRISQKTFDISITRVLKRTVFKWRKFIS
jgi:hypothetical protein